MQLKKLDSWLQSFVMGYVLLSTGCAPVAFIGAATGITTCASEERGLKTVWTDAKIKSAIQIEWSQYKTDLIHQIDVVVHQGQVLLTGTADSPQMQIDAVRLVWKVPGVKEVIDETAVGQEGNFGEYAQDSWISAQLKSKIFVDNDIRSLNYNIQTVNGIVYLMGIAQNKQELNCVVDYARHINGVKKVVSHVVIKGQEKSINYKTSSGSSMTQSRQLHSAQHSEPHTKSPTPLDAESIDESTVEIDNRNPIIQNDSVKVESLNSPNTSSSFQ